MEDGTKPSGEPRQQPVFDNLQYAVAVPWSLDRPVDLRLAEMRHRRQRVESRMTGRRHAAVGSGRVMDVERRVLGEAAAAIDFAEQLGIAWPEQDRVVGHVRPFAAGPEMDDEQRG